MATNALTCRVYGICVHCRSHLLSTIPTHLHVGNVRALLPSNKSQISLHAVVHNIDLFFFFYSSLYSLCHNHFYYLDPLTTHSSTTTIEAACYDEFPCNRPRCAHGNSRSCLAQCSYHGHFGPCGPSSLPQ